MAAPAELRQIDDAVFELPASWRAGMRVPIRVFATRELVAAMDDAVFHQAANVASLDGIVGASCVMPDAHWGYGFPIGGVAAMDARHGVVSPGGIGFDIGCGMRLAMTDLTLDEVQPKLRTVVDALYRRLPAGVGARGALTLSHTDLRDVLVDGARWAVRRGFGSDDDLARTENQGRYDGADPAAVSARAVERGADQVGTLGSGNHYLEVQVVRPEHVVDEALAAAFGITRPNQVAVMFHCGSRGLGHQVASESLEAFLRAMPRHGLSVADRELACAPIGSPEGARYLAAMHGAANMSLANRQVILHRVREVFADAFGARGELRMVYDVSHNVARVETHTVDGRARRLVVHRKGATRAFGPGSTDLAAAYRDVGQPIIIGGSMETGSYLLAGRATAAAAFFSTAHGSGRTMSRSKAKKAFDGRDLHRRMESRGMVVRAASWSGLAEEAGAAYKDVEDVVLAAERAGLSRRVARFTPIGNVKG